MNDQEFLQSTGRCWACKSDLTQLNGEPDQEQGFVKCECMGVVKRKKNTVLRKKAKMPTFEELMDKFDYRRKG